jgi:hypothetical protein
MSYKVLINHWIDVFLVLPDLKLRTSIPCYKGDNCLLVQQISQPRLGLMVLSDFPSTSKIIYLLLRFNVE